MADYNSSLPIRSEKDGTDERVHVKIYDGTTSPAVNAVNVDSDNNLHVEIHGNNAAGGDTVIRTSELGNIALDGVYDGTNNTIPSNTGLVSLVRNIAPGAAQQTQMVTGKANAAGDIRTIDVSLLDSDAVPYSASNPLNVTIVNNIALENVDDYQASASPLAKLGVENHDYTVGAGVTFKLKQIQASASGKIKIQLIIDGATKKTWFNSTANTNIEFSYEEAVTVAATKVVRIAITNLDNSAFDVYSSIMGFVS